MIDINKTKAKYLVLDLITFDIREEEKGPAEDPNILKGDKCRTTELWLRRIEPGTFMMGSPEDELGRDADETQHKVTLSQPFYIGVFQVTQKQYELITGENPSIFKGDTRPVENVSYNMIRGEKAGIKWKVDRGSFLDILRSKINMCFDLPTEAQWEYACRALTKTAFNNGKPLTDEEKCQNLAEVGRYNGNLNDGKGGYKEHTTVGSYRPNFWGLYDMHGNVWEWCRDLYALYNSYDSEKDPKGSEIGFSRVLRGGGWRSFVARRCRSATRGHYFGESNIGDAGYCRGFRLVIVQE